VAPQVGFEPRESRLRQPTRTHSILIWDEGPSPRSDEQLSSATGGPSNTEKKKRCPPSWARLIHKVYHADPLVCGELDLGRDDRALRQEHVLRGQIDLAADDDALTPRRW